MANGLGISPWPAEGPESLLEPPRLALKPLGKLGRAWAIARTLPALGLDSVALVAQYRVGLKLGRLKRLLPDGPAVEGPFFWPEAWQGEDAANLEPIATEAEGEAASQVEAPTLGSESPPTAAKWQAPPPPPLAPGADPAAEALWAGGQWAAFGLHPIPLRSDIDWQADPLTGGEPWPAEAHWEDLPDFRGQGVDVKSAWEAGRFAWAPVLAAAGRSPKASGALARDQLEALVASWAKASPPYRGVHWKCGQESALRALMLAAAWAISTPGQAPSPAMLRILGLHAQRIAPTLGYAQGQNNNHGTSEAAGLLAVGAIMARYGGGGARKMGEAWAREGQSHLRERVMALVAEDGGFSQASLSYHRLLLDTMSLSAFLGEVLGHDPFGHEVRQRLGAAVRWFASMVEPSTGDAPNWGANDGAMLLAFGGPTYRDFRPSLQLASTWFLGLRPLPPGPWDAALAWLGPSTPPPASSEFPPRQGAHHPKSGQLILSQGPWWAMLNLPQGRFRPSQADALHLELWHQGHPVAVDAGSYGYAHPEGPRFTGARAHNRVVALEEEPMARLSTFLWAAPWEVAQVEALAPREAEGPRVTASVSWGRHRQHGRRLDWSEGGLVVEDELRGAWAGAELRWRLQGEWALQASGRRALLMGPGGLRLEVEALGGGACHFSLRPGLQSPGYLALAPVQVLVAEVGLGGLGWRSHFR